MSGKCCKILTVFEINTKIVISSKQPVYEERKLLLIYSSWYVMKKMYLETQLIGHTSVPEETEQIPLLKLLGNNSLGTHFYFQ